MIFKEGQLLINPNWAKIDARFKRTINIANDVFIGIYYNLFKEIVEGNDVFIGIYYHLFKETVEGNDVFIGIYYHYLAMINILRYNVFAEILVF